MGIKVLLRASIFSLEQGGNDHEIFESEHTHGHTGQFTFQQICALFMQNYTHTYTVAERLQQLTGVKHSGTVNLC